MSYQMRFSLFFITLASLASCVQFPMMDDMMKNRYFEVEVYADASAPYVGEWTSANPGGIYTNKIYPDGFVLSCMKNATTEIQGKVFLDKGKPAIIYEGGTVERIIAVDNGSMTTDTYDQKTSYHVGDVPDRCRAAFDRETKK